MDSAERIGFGSVAFWGGAPHFDLDYSGYDNCEKLKKQFSDHGLHCTSFTAATAFCRFQFALFEKDHIEDCFRYFANGVRAAAELGSNLMAVNSGFGYYCEKQEDAWKRSCDMLYRIAEIGRKYGVVLALETLREMETKLVVTTADQKRMLEEINHPNLKAMVDTAAMEASQDTLWECFETFGDKIVNMHFVDFAGGKHVSWGDGNSDLEDFVHCLNEYNYPGPLGLELFDERSLAEPHEAMSRSYRALMRYVSN
jgi:protein FrlC